MNAFRISILFPLTTALTTALSLACGGRSEEAQIVGPADPAPPGPEAAAATPFASSESAAASRPTEAAQTVFPKLFVRGFGTSLDAIAGSARTFDAYKLLLEKEGFDAKTHAHDLGNYDDGKSMVEMTAQVAGMLEAAMKKYPEGTKFDVFGHSLGGILALRAVLEKLEGHVRTFVALSAPVLGQDTSPLNCQLGLKCSDVYAFYKPFKNDKILAYMQQHDAALKSMTLCSQVSPDDGVIKSPMEGAQFPTGKNIVTPKISHLQIIKSEVAVKALKEQCFGGAF